MTPETLQKFESPAEIGNALRVLRESSGYSLDQIASETKIALDVLKAIEDGRWERLGSKFLVKSFVRMYCCSLKTSPDPFVEAIENIGESYRRDHYFEKLLQQRPRRIKNKSRFVFYTVVILISSFMVSGGVYLFHRSNRLPEPKPGVVLNSVPPPPEINHGSEPVTPSVGVVDREHSSLEPLQGQAVATSDNPSSTNREVEEEVPAPLERGSDEPSLPAEDKSLRVRAVDEAWVRIWVNEKKPVSKLLAAGEELVFSDAEKAKLILGNAGKTQITWHGRELPFAGKPGQVVRLTLPDDIPELKSQQ